MDSTLGTTNFNTLANQVLSYGGLGLWGIAFLTQLLALFGLFPEINYLVWYVGIGILYGTVGMTY